MEGMPPLKGLRTACGVQNVSDKLKKVHNHTLRYPTYCHGLMTCTEKLNDLSCDWRDWGRRAGKLAQLLERAWKFEIRQRTTGCG